MLNGRVVSNLDGANFPKVLTLLEQNHADIPNGQLAALRAEMSKFKECGQKEIIAMYMEEEDKVLVTLGRKAFDVSRMIVSVGFKHVDGSEYTKFEISITEENAHDRHSPPPQGNCSPDILGGRFHLTNAAR